MNQKLRVLIHGSGFAGQGHALAFRTAGAEIVGMVSRTESVVKDVAKKCDIPYAGTNWQQALEELQPDIISIGTPGGAHFEAILAGLEHNCHIFCDKPLTATAAQAKELYLKAKEKGVKTAFAASYRYMPYVTYARQLISDGLIGEPQESECISHYNLEPLIPFGWSHTIEQGGGRLNNNFVHKLSIILQLLDADVDSVLNSVSGETRSDMQTAPIVTDVHDFRTRRNYIPKNIEDSNLQWATVDSEWSYTILAKLSSSFAPTQPVSALFKHSGLQPRFNQDSIALYGSKGAIHIQGSYAQGPLYYFDKSQPEAGWKEYELPATITEALPAIQTDTERNWACLAQEFVNDVLGKEFEAYQTFEDGWKYQEVIEAVRNHI